jgi:hypothetical protein
MVYSALRYFLWPELVAQQGLGSLIVWFEITLLDWYQNQGRISRLVSPSATCSFFFFRPLSFGLFSRVVTLSWAVPLRGKEWNE